MRFLTIFITLLIISFEVSSQDLSFTNYSTRDGLSSAQVYDIFQDINGDMLFATDRGITKYDGYSFKIYSVSEGLTSNTVFDFSPQKNGDIWCSTIDNSWFYFRNGTTDFTSCQNNELIQKHSFGALADNIWINNDEIFIGFKNFYGFLSINTSKNSVNHPLSRESTINNAKDSIDAVFIHHDQNQFKFYQIQGQNKQDLFNYPTKSITTGNGLEGYKQCEFINDKHIFTSHSNLIISDQQDHRIILKFKSKIIGLGKFDDNHFWIGVLDGGIKIIDMNGNETQQWLRGHSPTALFKDKNDGIWVATLDKGVFFAQNDFIKLHETNNNNFIFSISPGLNSAPLISTLTTHYQYTDGILRLISHIEGDAHKPFYNFLSDDYEFFVRTTTHLNNRDVQHQSGVIDFSENLQLPPLIATGSSFVTYNNNSYQNTSVNTRIRAIEHANNGVLFGGSNGLHFYSFKTQSTIKFNFKPLQGRISDIKMKGVFHFIGTKQFGLVRYNQEKEKYLQITQKDGLSSNLINEIFAESESEIWVATNFGLNHIVFNGNSHYIEHLGIENGLLDNDVSDVYIYLDTIWIGTRSGLFSIPKSKFNIKSHSTDLNLFWSNVQCNNRVYSPQKKLTLGHNENNLELEFHSAFYGGKNRVKYRYKIHPSDNQWHAITGRTIYLNGLQPGKYKITLQANVDESNWTDNQITLEVTINPPFHQTWWLRTILGGLIALIIYFLFKIRLIIYNRTLVKELLRLIIRKLNPQAKSFIVLEQGKEHRINSQNVLYLQSNGNYLIIQTKNRKYTIRYKIGEYNQLIPDKMEYLRVHKSYIVRIDKITGKNLNAIFIEEIEIPIGKTYKKLLKDLTI